jgi:acetyltransferase-like isoleucine patch superfamily enzyme
MKIHATADVQTTKIGEGTLVWQHCVILPGAQIGKNCNINAFCFIENDVVIGDNITLKCGVYVWDGITLENDVHIGPNVTFTNDMYPRSKHNFRVERTTICRGASVGANSTLVPGITVGRYAMIGAGSVVTKNVPGNSLWFGSPARHIAYICDCGQRLGEDLHCSECGSDYSRDENGSILKK